MEISAEERIRLLDSIVQSESDAVMITEPTPHDEQGPRILCVNEAFSRLTGYSEQDVVGRSPFFLVGPQTNGEARARVSAAMSRFEPVRVVVLNYRKDGRPYWADVTIYPVRGPDGSVTHFAGFGRETTPPREADVDRQWTSSILESITDALFASDRAWRLTYVNLRATELVGLPAEALLGRNAWELFPALVGTDVERQARRALEDGKPTRFEMHGPRADTWLQIHLYPSAQGLSAYVQDVSDRKRAEQALVDARLRMELALAAGAVGTWEWDVRTNTCVADARMAQLFSVDPEQAARGIPIEVYLGAIHPEDRARVKAKIEEVVESCDDFAEEYRVRAQDGTVRWVSARGRAEGEDGIPQRVPGAVVEVTEQKRAAEALRHAHEGVKSLIRASPLAILELDACGLVQMWNPAAERLFGWREREVLRRAPPYFPPEIVSEAKKVLDFARRGETFTGVITERVRKDGSRVPVSLSTAPVRDELGELGSVLVMLEDITARQEAEDAQRRLTAIFEATPDVVATVDTRGRFLHVNRTGRELWGFGEDQVREHALEEVLPGWAARVVLDEAMPAAMRDGSWQGEVALLARDGQEIPVSKVMIAHRRPSGEVDYLSMLNRDITDLKRIERIQSFLSEASRTLSGSLDLDQVLTLIPALLVPQFADICVVDLLEKEGETTLRTRAARHRDDQKQRLIDELVSLVPHPACKAIVRTLDTGEPELATEVTEQRLRELSYSDRQLAILQQLAPRSTLTVPLRSHGRVVGALTCMNAESGRRYRPADLPLAVELADRVALALDNAELFRSTQRAVRTRDEVLRIVAHDLRNPLNAISLSAQRLFALLPAEAPAEDATRKHLTLIRRSVERSNRLIQDLLDVARLQGGPLAITRRSEDSSALVRQAIELHRPLAAEKQVTLEESLEGEPGLVSADRDRLLQVFANLIGNALKFTPSGGRITVRASRSSGEVCFSVADTGPGIPVEHLSHIFEPFWQVRAGVKEGAGLGLTISRGIVEAHGGRVWAESEPGRGATFRFTVPVAADGG